MPLAMACESETMTSKPATSRRSINAGIDAAAVALVGRQEVHERVDRRVGKVPEQRRKHRFTTARRVKPVVNECDRGRWRQCRVLKAASITGVPRRRDA